MKESFFETANREMAERFDKQFAKSIFSKIDDVNEKDIQHKLKKKFSTHEYILTNSYVFSWESDFFSMAKSGYFYEVEIKISVADFKKDFEKVMKHRCLSNSKSEYVARITDEVVMHSYDKNRETGKITRSQTPKGYCRLSYKKVVVPNRFFYAVPEELVDNVINLVPEYAGLLSVSNGVTEIKSAPLLHNKKCSMIFH